MSTTEPLLPCPFCGGEAEIHDIGNDLKKPRKTEIVCTQCHVKKVVAAIHNPLSWTRATAIEEWNRRTPPAVPDVSKTVKQRAWEIADQLWLDTNEKSKLARLICDAFSASPTPPVDDGWRPIETAPRDGTVIDVWLGCAEPEDVEFYCGPGNTRRAASWHWHKGKFRPAMGLEDAVPPVFVQPTHWRPLPPPPGESE